MTRRTASALCCLGLWSVLAFAGEVPKVPACCAKETGKKAEKLRCSLTGKEVEKCCCVEREGGRLHCTLANKDVVKCCCSEVKAEGKEAK